MQLLKKKRKKKRNVHVTPNIFLLITNIMHRNPFSGCRHTLAMLPQSLSQVQKASGQNKTLITSTSSHQNFTFRNFLEFSQPFLEEDDKISAELSAIHFHHHFNSAKTMKMKPNVNENFSIEMLRVKFRWIFIFTSPMGYSYSKRNLHKNLRMYLYWTLCTLHLHARQLRVTVVDSGLCCCTCVTYFKR